MMMMMMMMIIIIIIINEYEDFVSQLAFWPYRQAF
jgi:uncharacterized membrane protein YqhA